MEDCKFCELSGECCGLVVHLVTGLFSKTVLSYILPVIVEPQNLEPRNATTQIRHQPYQITAQSEAYAALSQDNSLSLSPIWCFPYLAKSSHWVSVARFPSTPLEARSCLNLAYLGDHAASFPQLQNVDWPLRLFVDLFVSVRNTTHAGFSTLARQSPGLFPPGGVVNRGSTPRDTLSIRSI
ncbi:hypothetical protein BGZ63DRAFT_39901 [Mariannaea sp. PMI_226]|nr:hypothetical protein BGZ63DRAFT_39901 [Mariannaea sp. PMI_226]